MLLSLPLQNAAAAAAATATATATAAAALAPAAAAARSKAWLAKRTWVLTAVVVGMEFMPVRLHLGTCGSNQYISEVGGGLGRIMIASSGGLSMHASVHILTDTHCTSLHTRAVKHTANKLLSKLGMSGGTYWRALHTHGLDVFTTCCEKRRQQQQQGVSLRMSHDWDKQGPAHGQDSCHVAVRMPHPATCVLVSEPDASHRALRCNPASHNSCWSTSQAAAGSATENSPEPCITPCSCLTSHYAHVSHHRQLQAVIPSPHLPCGTCQCPGHTQWQPGSGPCRYLGCWLTRWQPLDLWACQSCLHQHCRRQ